MNQITAPPELLVRDIPLDRLTLAPENVRKTQPDRAAQAELEASIRAHGLLENLVVRIDDAGVSKSTRNAKGAKSKTSEKFAVVAGGRRLLALTALAKAGFLSSDEPVSCRIVKNENLEELSLAENVVRIPMHPADQVVSFARLVREGATVASIAARFGVSERIVEQRLRLGNVAPELLDAYRAGEMDLEALKGFSMTTDQDRQRRIWKQMAAESCRPTAWNIRRMLTEERVSSDSSLARFVGVDEYVAAGGPVMQDLFAEEDESGEWFEDPVLLRDLAMKKLTAAADELSTRWKWALPLLEVNWTSIYEYGQIEPQPGKPTAREESDLERINARMDELSELPDENWNEKLEREAGKLEDRLEGIREKVAKRAKFRREDFSRGGCIVTIERDGRLKIIQGLVRIEDMPVPDSSSSSAGTEDDNRTDSGTSDGESNIIPPTGSGKSSSPEAQAREEAGIGIGLADDLRVIRNAIVKAHLAEDFEATFDLMVFQLSRAVFFSNHYAGRDVLDISIRETLDRPTVRMNDDHFADWSPAEATINDWTGLPLAWMEKEDDGARFAALRELPREKKEELFAAAVARTLKGQLSFEYFARPQFEATVARLDIDFAKEVRPTADLLWSRLRKDHLLAIAAGTLGGKWAQDRSKYRKADLAMAMEKTFEVCADGVVPVSLDADQHAAAMAWTIPGFAPFEASVTDSVESVTGDESATDGEPATDTAQEESPVAKDEAGKTLRVVNGNGMAEQEGQEDQEKQEETGPADTEEAEESVPGFLQAVH